MDFEKFLQRIISISVLLQLLLLFLPLLDFVYSDDWHIAQIFIYFSSAFPFFFSFFLPPPPSPSLTSVSLFLASSSSPFNPFSFLLPLLLQLLLLHLVFSFNFSPLFLSLSCNSSPTTKHGEGRVISKPLVLCMYGFRVLGFMHRQQIQWAEHLKSIHIYYTRKLLLSHNIAMLECILFASLPVCSVSCTKCIIDIDVTQLGEGSPECCNCLGAGLHLKICKR